MEEFKKMYNEANEKLYNKGYYVSNMIYNSEYYELADGNGKVVIDYLSLSQLCSYRKCYKYKMV